MPPKGLQNHWDSRGVPIPGGPEPPQKNQRSLKKAAMLATNCKLQTRDWKLDPGDLTRGGHGEFHTASSLPVAARPERTRDLGFRKGCT